MTDKLLESLIDHSSQVEEQRADNKRHLLLYIIIAICAVICDANEWTDIRQEGDIHGERLGFGQWASVGTAFYATLYHGLSRKVKEV